MAVGEKGLRGWFRRFGQRSVVLILILALGLVFVSELGSQHLAVSGAKEEMSPASAVKPSQSGGAWQQVNTPSIPGNLSGHSLVVIDNDAYLFGGVAPTTAHTGDAPAQVVCNNLYKYDNEIQAWIERIPGLSPPARANHAAAVVDGKMVIHGGTDGTNVLNDLWVYNPATKTWIQKTPPGPVPPALQYHKAVVSGGHIYLVGGTGSGGGPSDQLWAYDSTASSWTQKASYPGPFGGTYGAAVLTPDSSIMVGGTTGDTYYVYNPATNSWEAKTATNFPNRESPGAAQVGTFGYIFGGRDMATGEYSVESWKADLSGGTTEWEPLPPMMPNIQPDVVLLPEAHSPTTPGWMRAFLNTEVGTTQGQPGVLLYGRSWAYDPDNPLPIPIWGDASTWIFWPDASAAGALDGIGVWPRSATLEMGEQQAFGANGHDNLGFYVPITPTWSASGGSVTGFGLYTAGDLPGVYQVRAEDGALADEVDVTISGANPCPDLDPGESWSHSFPLPGTYPYYDRANPDHAGTVVVNPTAATHSGPQATWDVSLTATGFDPPGITIAFSDTVRWTNDDTETHAVNGGEHNYRVYLPLVMRQSP